MIHTYRQGGYNIALDVNSGAVHALSDAAFEILQNCTGDKLPETGDPEALSELRTLQEEGLLFSEDTDVDLDRVFPGNPPLKALCLHIAHDCNLRCKYCFASTGDFGTGRKIMPIEVAKQAIDFVISRSQNRRNIEIDFFGGEPLMGFDTVRETVAYAKEQGALHGKTFRFTITTNGLGLNEENMAYINREMSNVVLSLDGREAVHDRMRKTISGEGSYRYIVPKFQALLKDRDPALDHYLRGTFTRDNLDFVEDVLHIKDLGFSEISVEPVTADEHEPYALREEDLPKIFTEYERLAEYMKDHDDFRFFHFMVDLDQGPCIIKRIRGCGAGYEYAAVTPDGDVYPCHQFVGKEEYCMGSVLNDTFSPEISHTFRGMNICTREACKTCWAKYYCSGGCSASNLNQNGDLNLPYEMGCELEKKRLECAIMLKVHRAMQD